MVSLEQAIHLATDSRYKREHGATVYIDVSGRMVKRFNINKLFPTEKRKMPQWKNIMISGQFFDTETNGDRGGELLFVNCLCVNAGYENVRHSIESIGDCLKRTCSKAHANLIDWADRYVMDGDLMLLQACLYAVFGMDMTIARYLKERRMALLAGDFEANVLKVDFQGCKYHWIFSVLDSVKNLKGNVSQKHKKMLTNILMRTYRWCYDIPFDAEKRQQNAEKIAVVVEFLMYILCAPSLQQLFDNHRSNQQRHGIFNLGLSTGVVLDHVELPLRPSSNDMPLATEEIAEIAIVHEAAKESQMNVPETIVSDFIASNPYYDTISSMAQCSDISPFEQWICMRCGKANILGKEIHCDGPVTADKARTTICTHCRSPNHEQYTNGDGVVLSTIDLVTSSCGSTR